MVKTSYSWNAVKTSLHRYAYSIVMQRSYGLLKFSHHFLVIWWARRSEFGCHEIEAKQLQDAGLTPFEDFLASHDASGDLIISSALDPDRELFVILCLCCNTCYWYCCYCYSCGYVTYHVICWTPRWMCIWMNPVKGIIAPKVTDDWDTPTKTKCSPHRWPLLTFNIYNCWVSHGGGECWAGDGREFGAANTRHPCERTWVLHMRGVVSIYLPHAGWDWGSHDSICFGMGLMGLRYYIYILWPFGQVEHIVENHHFSQYFTIFHHILETNITKISPKFPPYFGHRISTICQHLGSWVGWFSQPGVLRAGSETCRVKGLVITFTGNGDKNARSRSWRQMFSPIFS